MKISEVLIKARDVIQERGWTKGNWRGPNGEVCLETAISTAMGVSRPSSVNDLPVGRTLAAYLGLKRAERCWCGCGGYVGGGSLASWNDRAGRTVEEVIEALEVCALIEAEKEARQPVAEVVVPPATWTETGEPKPTFFIPTVTLSATGDLPFSIKWEALKPDKELVSV